MGTSSSRTNIVATPAILLFSFHRRDNLCAVDKLAIVPVLMNHFHLLWLFMQQGAWCAFWHLVAMVGVIGTCHVLTIHNLVKHKDRYYRNRWRFIIVHRLIRAVAFYVGSSFLKLEKFAEEPFHGLLGLDQPQPLASLLAFVRPLVLRTGCMLGYGYVFMFPINFSLQLCLHIACLPGFLMNSADTAKILERPEYAGHVCAVYNGLEWLVPGLDYHTRSKADDAGCTPHASLVLAHTVRHCSILRRWRSNNI